MYSLIEASICSFVSSDICFGLLPSAPAVVVEQRNLALLDVGGRADLVMHDEILEVGAVIRDLVKD